ncbi:hypothetical protein V1477_021120 [Vespula maculifrons]|uniref:Uncharacterized protein n=1 Tax=Vespula maculifrons TaxID=7453 RepID=A0ABD2AH80_VESMC
MIHSTSSLRYTALGTFEFKSRIAKSMFGEKPSSNYIDHEKVRRSGNYKLCLPVSLSGYYRPPDEHGIEQGKWIDLDLDLLIENNGKIYFLPIPRDIQDWTLSNSPKVLERSRIE